MVVNVITVRPEGFSAEEYMPFKCKYGGGPLFLFHKESSVLNTLLQTKASSVIRGSLPSLYTGLDAGLGTPTDFRLANYLPGPLQLDHQRTLKRRSNDESW